MINALVCHEFGEAEKIKFQSIEPLIPKEDEVLIQVAYAGVNFPDTLIVQGKYQIRPELPFVPGQEVTGEVIVVGDKVDHVIKGDMVLASMTWGAFANQAIAKGSN
ncbi:MAG: alcohol dehydrogenase catalytic domain-containing protein, partial [Marinoscillum sp.]